MTGIPMDADEVQGDFLDGIVEAAVRGLAGQLKAELRSEFCRVLKAAKRVPGCPLRPDLRRAHSMECMGEVPPPRVEPELLRTCAFMATQRNTSPGRVQQAPNDGQPEWAPETREETPQRGPMLPFLNVPGCLDYEDTGSQGMTSDRGIRCSMRSRSVPAGVKTFVADSPPPPRPSKTSRDQTSGDLAKCRTGTLKELTDTEEQVLRQFRKEEEEHIKRIASVATHRRHSMMSEIAMSERRLTAFNIIASSYFDFAIGAVIVANSVTIGVESTVARHGGDIPIWLHACEYSFLVVYIIELSLRLFALGLGKAFKSHWVKFDALLVFSGVANFLVTIFSLGGSSASFGDNINMLKMIRLLRLARTVRVLVQFRTLWLLVQGLMYSIMPMLWTTVIMLVVVYVFAVAGMEMIVPNSADEDYMTAAQNFSSIGKAMVTLVQFIALDSMAAIYRPLIFASPALVFYFLPFFLLGPIALMNIVTAIMVESSLRTANEDAEAKKTWETMKRKAMLPKLRAIFLAMDTDGDGEVDLFELLQAPDAVKDQVKRIVDLDELEEIFHMLDYDGSGSISVDEFVDGIMRSQADKPSELIVLLKQNKAILEILRGGESPFFLGDAARRSQKWDGDTVCSSLPLGDQSTNHVEATKSLK